MPKAYDIAVLGATAAGYASALMLARSGHSAVVLDTPASPTESPLCDWLPADVLRVCPPLKSLAPTATDGPFRTVRFHSADLARQAEYKRRTPAGYLLRSARFLGALDRAARKAGVRRLRSAGPAELDLREKAVEIRIGTRALRASLLLIAQDSPAEVIGRLHLPTRTVPTGKLSVCGLDVPLPRGGVPEALPGALHAVAVGGQERLGMFFVAGGLLHVRILSAEPAPPAGAKALGELIGNLQGAGLLPEKLSLSRAVAAVWRPPGGVALELETHLAKRTLLVGTAGGFASATTGQTLDPSVRSARVAAGIAEKALRAAQPQDALAEYKNQWRNALADRIRPTGTSLQMLMPMVLANQAMTTRFAKALLYGESL